MRVLNDTTLQLQELRQAATKLGSVVAATVTRQGTKSAGGIAEGESTPTTKDKGTSLEAEGWEEVEAAN